MTPTRHDIEFLSAGVTCRAWFYSPPDADGKPRPCIVMAHGLGGTRDSGLEPYAERFAAAGYAVLLFDYRHFGASDGQPRQLIDIGRQLDDWAAAIRYARSRLDVDPLRVALWGTSFAGGHVIVAAARDGRVAAVSAQGPMMDGPASALMLARYAGPWMFLRLGLAGIVDLARAAFGLSPLYVPLIAPPGQFAAMASHDAYTGFSAIVPPGWRNEHAARLGLLLLFYRPILSAESVLCPALIQVCMRDSVASAASGVATAQRMGLQAQLLPYDLGHYDIYVGRGFERAVADQLAFFHRVLGGPG